MKSTRPYRLAIFLVAAFLVSSLAFAQADKDTQAARDTTQKLFTVFKNKDWHTLFDIIQLSPTLSKSMTDRDAFATAFDKGLKEGDPNNEFDKLVGTMDNVSIGAAIIEDKNAYVSTTCTVKVEGQSVRFVGIAKLVKVAGAWRWDLSFTDDADKASETRFTQLLGEPSKEEN
jgi:hypothetical protein